MKIIYQKIQIQIQIDRYCTLLSNLSISIKNIQIILKLEQEEQYELLISGINIELHKTDSNNILYVTTTIDLIELKLKNVQIALMEKAMKFNMILETKDNNQIKLKINGNVSSLDIMLNKKQIKNILKLHSNYRSKVDQINAALILLQNQPQGLAFTQSDKRDIKLLEMKDFEALNNELSKSKELNSFINIADEKKNFLISQQQYLNKMQGYQKYKFEQILINYQIDFYQNKKLVFSMKNYKQFQQQLNDGETNCYINSTLKNQKEKFKCYFQGIKLAICEDVHYFPQMRERFFEDLQSHFFIEINDIQTEYHKSCFKFNIQTIAAYRITSNSPPFKSNPNSANNSANSEIFFTCKSFEKQVFLVSPVVLIGKHQIQKFECDFSIYNFENFEQQSDGKNAIDVNIQLLKCKDKKLFYQVKAEFSQIIALFRHESIINLLTYIPKTSIQQLQLKKTHAVYGFEINIPEIKLSYLMNEKTLTLKFKGMTLKQKPTKTIELKTGFLETFEDIKYFENPIQLIIVVFNQIELECEGQNIFRIDQGIINKIHTYPTIYFAIQEVKQIKKDRLNVLESLFNYKKQKCDIIISGLIPNLELQLSQNFLQWLISLREYIQKLKNKKSKKILKKLFRPFYQLKINLACIGIQDNCLDNIFYLELKSINIVKAKQILILIQDIIAIDSQSPIPQKGDSKYKNFQSAQIILYRMKNEINQVEYNIKNNSFERLWELYNLSIFQITDCYQDEKPILDQISFQVMPKSQNKSQKNVYNVIVCLRISDFQFKSFQKLEALINYYSEVEIQIQYDWLCKAQIISENMIKAEQIQVILEEDIFIDVIPLNSVEKFSNKNQLQNQLLILLRVSNAKISSNLELSSIDIYIIGQNEIENQFPLILNGFFDNKSHILQFGSQLKIKNVKYQDKLISIDQIIGNFKYDTIQSLIEITRDLSKLIPQANIQASQEQYKISQDFNQQLINQKIIEQMYQFNIGQLSIELEQGITYYEIDVIYDDIKINYTINEQDDTFNQGEDSDKICINFTKCLLKVEIYKEGQIGIRYKSYLEIQDKIDKLYYKLVLRPDFQEFDLQDNSPFNVGLIIENKAYTGFISIVPMKIYISGSLLQFIINFMSNNTINEKRIDLDQIEIIQDMLSMIWLKNLQIYETKFNITYDSSGLKVDGLLKGLLKIGSFCNLQITLKNTEIQCKGDLKYVQEQIIEAIQESFGSKYQIAGQALQKLDAFTQLKYLGNELLNLFKSPFESIGVSSNTIDLQKSLSDVVQNLKNGQEVIQKFKFSSFSRFLKRY